MSIPDGAVGRTAKSKFSAAIYKSIRVSMASWKRARICAIEIGKPVGLWVAEAIALKADLQQREGTLSKRGARVATQAVVIGTTKQTDEADPQ